MNKKELNPIKRAVAHAQKLKTFDIVLLGLLVALNIALERVVGFVGASNAYSVSFIVVAFAASKYGILGGVVVSGLGDFLGAFLNGGPNICITLVAVLLGVFYGIALNEKTGKYNILKPFLAVLSSQIFCTLLLNTFFICLFYIGINNFLPTFAGRVVQSLVLTPVQIIIIHILMVKVFPKIKLPTKY